VIVELSMRRNLLQALTALQRREIDAAAGNVAGLSEQLPAELSCELVTTSPLAALVHQHSPLATRATITPDDLRQHGLWWPTQPGSVELNQFAAAYAEPSASRCRPTHATSDSRHWSRRSKPTRRP
jgi:hypothetical protein